MQFEKTRGGSVDLKKATKPPNESRHNYSFVLLAKGVHNIEYAFNFLMPANNKAEQARAAINKSYKPQEFSTRMTCTTLCHVGMERRTVPFK